MPPKRPYKRTGRIAKKYGVSPNKAVKSAITIQRAVRTYLNKQIETKSACKTSSDYIQIGHNSYVALEAGDLLATTQGVSDPNNSQLLCRIGDQINLKNISIRMMIELNERYSDVSYRILVIKSAKADSLAGNNLFVGLSGNKMLDRIDREKFTVLYEKWGKITARNTGAFTALAGTTTVGGGFYEGDTDTALTRATKIIKINLPGKLFSKSGIIQYENGSSQVKFYDYHFLVYAYSNYSTSSLLGYNVLAVNDYVKEMYYKDA